MSKKQIFFLGCGKMGGAIINNFLKSGAESSSFLVLKPHDDNKITTIKYVNSYEKIDKNYRADIVFFTFKPQMAEAILKDFARQQIYHSHTIFISILAGKKISFFENILGKNIKLIRLMPNLPIVVNEGIFAYFCNANIKEAEISFYLNSLGKNIKLDQEELLDAVTAISGSGPAYLFLFTRMIIESAKKLGLSEENAKIIVKQTIYGSAKMALESKENLEHLIENVSSKGGTTEAALEILNQDNIMHNIIDRAIVAAYDKSRILADS